MQEKYIITQPVQDLIQPIVPLILTAPDSELSELISQGNTLIQHELVILEKIDKDLDNLAKEKKKQRLEDKRWCEEKNLPLPGIKMDSNPIHQENLDLAKGRPRMEALVVFMFMLIRGYFGGIKSKEFNVLFRESITIRLFLEGRGLSLPGLSTISENVNGVSNETREYILDAQIRMAIGEGLDDFKAITFDSTDVSANSAWPTDSTLLADLVERTYHRSQNLDKFGIGNMPIKSLPEIIKNMKRLSLAIQFTVGKRDGNKKRKKSYKELLRQADKAHALFTVEMENVIQRARVCDIVPSQKQKLLRLVDWMCDDIANMKKVRCYCHDRIFNGKTVESKEKVLSLADNDAALIVKGQREPTLGYKPQLGRSKQGFVSMLLVPRGNASDAGQFERMLEKAIQSTVVVPDSVSVDDGYANKQARENMLNKLGVKVVSISGAKGKKMIPPEEYESDVYKKCRNDRSAVESLMFTIKHNFGFGDVMRTGQENVRAELLEKVLVYNFLRVPQQRNRMVKEAA